MIAPQLIAVLIPLFSYALIYYILARNPYIAWLLYSFILILILLIIPVSFAFSLQQYPELDHLEPQLDMLGVLCFIMLMPYTVFQTKQEPLENTHAVAISAKNIGFAVVIIIMSLILIAAIVVVAAPANDALYRAALGILSLFGLYLFYKLYMAIQHDRINSQYVLRWGMLIALIVGGGLLIKAMGLPAVLLQLIFNSGLCIFFIKEAYARVMSPDLLSLDR